LDIRQNLDHAGVALDQHAACGACQARRVAMAYRGALAARRFQDGKTLALEPLGGLTRALVPDLARIVLLEAGTGVDDQKRTNALRMCTIEGKRHIAAER